MPLMPRYGYSFLAGTFAACGSFFGKLPGFLTTIVLTKNLDDKYLNPILINVLPITLMLFFNVMNWRYFLKALQKSEHTLTATVFTAATNYILSFSLGVLCYNESLTMLSTCGVSLIIFGLWFLCSANSPTAKKLQ